MRKTGYFCKKQKIMHPKMIWANLAVDDLERTTKFYTDLGFKPNGIPNDQLTSFIVGENKFVIHFFLKEALRSNMKIEISDAQSAAEILFTLSAESKEQVDHWAAEVTKAGGKLLSQPEAFGKGYYGFMFADPDGHRFNVFYM
jgi:uncharacterized protein